MLERIQARTGGLQQESPLSFLHKNELIRGEEITNACYLLFCKGPSPFTGVELGSFASETLIKDGETLKDDLFTQAEAILQFVRKHINKAIVITGEAAHIERWDYQDRVLQSGSATSGLGT